MVIDGERDYDLTLRSSGSCSRQCLSMPQLKVHGEFVNLQPTTVVEYSVVQVLGDFAMQPTPPPYLEHKLHIRELYLCDFER